MAARTPNSASASKEWVLDMQRMQHWSPEELDAIPALLVKWYDANRRKLPWRGDAAPYGKDSKTTSTHSMNRSNAEESAAAAMVEYNQGQPGRAAQLQEISQSSDDGSVIVLGSSEEGERSSQEAAGMLDDKCQPPPSGQGVSAYGTWVSEVMLQQTRVEAVIPHWLRWMERFPTCEALANASEEDVVAQWAGLGFYRRARQLRLGAQFVQTEMGGMLPQQPTQLQRVPGIGPYTAGAIASIAHGQRAPVVDGNVVRVWSRMRALPVDAKAPATIKGCWPISAQIVPESRPGDFNQALMELGATVCMPKAAHCERCPVSIHCSAHQQATEAQQPALVLQYPLATKKQANKVMHGAAVVPVWLGRGGGSFLIQQRSEGGLLSEAWGPPASILPFSEAAAAPSCADVWSSTCSAVGALQGGQQQLPPAAEAKHVFSGTTHLVQCTYACVPDPGASPNTPPGFRWCAVASAKDIKALGLTTWACKLLAVALAQLAGTAGSGWYQELARRAKLKTTKTKVGGKRPVDSSQRSLLAAWGAPQGSSKKPALGPAAQPACSEGSDAN